MGVDKGKDGVVYYRQLSELNFDLHLKRCAPVASRERKIFTYLVKQT